jgi:hypothetical protein
LLLIRLRGGFLPGSDLIEHIGGKVYDVLDPSDLSVGELHFDAAGVNGSLGQNTAYHALGQFSCPLVLLQHYLHPHAGGNMSSGFSVHTQILR